MKLSQKVFDKHLCFPCHDKPKCLLLMVIIQMTLVQYTSDREFEYNL